MSRSKSSGGSRVPTKRQFDSLRTIGRPGTFIVAPRKGEYGTLYRNGWAEPPEDDKPGKDGFPGFLQITPDGLRALAAAIERYGQLPFPKGPARD